MSDESLKGMAEQNKRYEYRSDGIFRFAYAVDRGSRRNHGWSGCSSEEIQLTGKFVITDTAVIDGKTRGFYAKSNIVD